MSAARFQPRSPPGHTPSAPVRFVTSSEHRATTLTQARKSRPARLRPEPHAVFSPCSQPFPSGHGSNALWTRECFPEEGGRGGDQGLWKNKKDRDRGSLGISGFHTVEVTPGGRG